MSERSEQDTIVEDTIRDVQMLAGAVYVYIWRASETLSGKLNQVFAMYIYLFIVYLYGTKDFFFFPGF